MSIPDLYPGIKGLYNPVLPITGKWPGGAPMGVMIHYTADDSLKRVVDDVRRSKIGYHLIIDRDGSVHQTAYLCGKVNHAGNAMWKKLSPNRHFLALALISWGALIEKDGKIYTWAGTELKDEERIVYRVGNLGRPEEPWDQATAEQEKSCLGVLRWLIQHGIMPEYIAGHDEAALPLGRKNDPGGVLSLSMHDLREMLIQEMI